MATPTRGETRPIPIKAGLIETQKLNANINASIHNRFDVEVIDTKTGEIKQRAHGENVICSKLWTRLFTPATYFNYIHYGTGSGTPAAADTSLFTFLGYGTPSTADDVYTVNATNGYASLRRKIQLDETTAVGSTLTEFGIGYSTTAATLCTHAMLKDMNGNTISIAKTNTDIINIYATVFLHWDVDSYDLDCRFLISQNITHFHYWLLGCMFGDSSDFLAGHMLIAKYGTAQPYGANSSGYYGIGTAGTDFYDMAKTFAYSAANKTLTITATRLAVGNANFPICSFGLYSCGNRIGNYMIYVPIIDIAVGVTGVSQTAITGEAIGTGDGNTKDFSTDFPLISNAAIYVDGVEQTSGVIIDTGMPLTPTNMGKYFVLMPQYSNSVNGISITMTATSHSSGATIGDYVTYYNPFYAKGITSYVVSTFACNVEVSDDLSTWVTLSTGTGTISVPSAYQNYKYWRITALNVNSDGINTLTSANVKTTNIHFADNQASGAVITANYTTATIAKDANHVFDFSLTIQLGEHTT